MMRQIRRPTRQLRPLLLVGAVACLCGLPLAAAHAQMSMGSGGGGGGADDAAAEEAKAAAAAAAPPPALPGAVPSDEAAPRGHVPLDVNPNAALFDAINRGDLTAAKDALSRGADLQAVNILGQKPLDMAIDLNRNDITFVLLSMRTQGADGGTQIASAQGGNAGGVAVEASAARRRSPVQEAADLRARRLAEDGGAARPDIGFLGFGGS
ncbi:ankyrin repeat domain-containing protein [Lichenicoccus sp.]|uniref:ankyrin repeat domain-containing protein n=1 Tax=Lichenicoccus sp. TaxID=2781899 RepID=UPI003D0B519A